MLKKNNVELSIIAETSGTNDVRGKMDWIAGKSRFITPYDGYDLSEYGITTNFRKNNVDTVFAKKGTRPNCNLRLSVTTPGQYYLIKFSDNSVRLTQNNVDYTATPEGTIIGTAEEDLKVLIGELQGAGGGAGGGGFIISSAGGAGGGYVLGVLKLEHEAGANWKKNSIPLKVGAGGYGVKDENKAGDGEDTGFYVNGTLALCASGGNGGDGTSGGSHREVVVSGVDSIFKLFHSANGHNGCSRNAHNTTGPYTFSGLGPESENTSLSYPQIVSGRGTVYGGDGGNSVMASGGSANNTAGRDGENGKGPGAGGAGGSGGGGSTGGSGANGLINFYY